MLILNICQNGDILTECKAYHILMISLSKIFKYNLYAFHGGFFFQWQSIFNLLSKTTVIPPNLRITTLLLMSLTQALSNFKGLFRDLSFLTAMRKRVCGVLIGGSTIWGARGLPGGTWACSRPSWKLEGCQNSQASCELTRPAAVGLDRSLKPEMKLYHFQLNSSLQGLVETKKMICGTLFKLSLK